MKISLYTPYLDSFGGGERYMLTIAEILSADNYVDFLLDDHQLSLGAEKLKMELSQRFNLNLDRVNFIKGPLGPGSNIVKRAFFLKQYDLLFYLTDGSIFYSTAKRSILHFQVPFKNNTAQNFWGKNKLSTWNLAICNSRFTQSVIEKEWPIESRVVYPPVDVEEIRPLKKKKQILSVGRFASFIKSKKHEDMIKAFRDLSESEKVDGWSLHLAGSVEGEKQYIDELRSMADGLPVFFYPDCPFNNLVTLYGESDIYWHAAGLNEVDPTKMEHFGISTVEAMAAGCVPVVINKGGQPEIIEDQKSGLLWDNLEQLQDLTLRLINDPEMMSKLSEEAIERSRIFSKARFAEEVQLLLDNDE